MLSEWESLAGVAEAEAAAAADEEDAARPAADQSLVEKKARLRMTVVMQTNESLSSPGRVDNGVVNVKPTRRRFSAPALRK